MPYKDKENQRLNQLRYNRRHKDKINERNRRKYHLIHQDPEIVKHDNERKRQFDFQIKLKVFTHYSKGIPKCACCGETTIEFLALDHINNNGKEDRKKGLSGANMYRYVKKNNYPEGFQILCHNCNQAKGMTKDHICPHKRK